MFLAYSFSPFSRLPFPVGRRTPVRPCLLPFVVGFVPLDVVSFGSPDVTCWYVVVLERVMNAVQQGTRNKRFC